LEFRTCNLINKAVSYAKDEDTEAIDVRIIFIFFRILRREDLTLTFPGYIDLS